MQMKFHPLKCKVMHLGSNNQRHEYRMKKDDGSYHTLESTTVEKDLCVFIDTSLSFTNHCQNKVNTANKILGCIGHTFKNMDAEIFLLLYKSMVRPHLEFSSCVWNPHHKYNIDALERVQRRATKLVPELRDLTYTERLQKLNLETLHYRRTKADLLEVYRITNGHHHLNQHCRCEKCPSKTMLQPTLSRNTRGNSKKMQIQVGTGPRKHFFSQRISPFWNSLSEKTVTSQNINSFKNNLNSEIAGMKFDFKFSY